MESLIYVPPLRAAVLWAIGLDRGAVPVATLATLAHVARDRAHAYASILVARQALAERPEGYVRGRHWSSWSAQPCRSRPAKATATGVEEQSEAMRQMRLAIARNVQRALDVRGWSIYELGKRSGVKHQHLYPLTKYATLPPVCQLLLVARALESTVEDLACMTCLDDLGAGRAP